MVPVSLSAAHRSLLQAAVAPLDRVAVSYAAWRRAVTFGAVDDEAYRLLPILSRTLDAAGVADDLTPRLRGVWRRTWYANQVALPAVRDAVRDLRGAGVSTRILGGPLSILHYRDDAGAYPLDGLDLLSSPGQHEAALAALQARGWRPTDARQDVCVLEHHRAGFVALHRRVAYGIRADADQSASGHAWRQARPVRLLGPDACLLSPEAHLLFLAEYRLDEGGVHPLRALTEASVLVSREEATIDWRDLAAQARLQQAGAALACLLQSLEVAIGWRAPGGFVDGLTAPEDMASPPEHARAHPVAARMVRGAWKAAGTVRRALRSVRLR